MEQHEPAIAVARRRAMLKGLRSRTRLIAGAGGVLAAATVGISVLNASLTQPLFPPLYGGVASLYLLAGFGGVVLALLLRISRYESELEAEAAIVQTREKLPATTSYFDSLVQINVENLAAYYSLAKFHTNNAFRVALAAGVLGFVLIAAGFVVGFAGQANQTPAYVGAASGVAVEFISGVFFFLYNRTVLQMKEYHDSLIAVQNVLLAFKLVDDTDAADEKAKLVAQVLALLLAGAAGRATPL